MAAWSEARLGRNTKQWQAMAKAVRDLGLACSLCGEPIDYTAPPRTSRSFSVDHVTPLTKGGSLLDPANLQPAHYGCNSAKGNRRPSTYRPSRVW